MSSRRSKKLSDTLNKAVFNDYEYCLLSNDRCVKISDIKEFDRYDKSNLGLYNDLAYKVVATNRADDMGLYEEKVLENGRIKRVKATGFLKQRIIITFSRKMMEYQRTVWNRQIERARKLLDMKDLEELKNGPNDMKRFMKRISQTKSGE